MMIIKVKNGKQYYQENLLLKIPNLKYFEKDDDDGDKDVDDDDDDAGDGDGDGDDEDDYGDEGEDDDDDDDCEELYCTDRCQTRFAQWEKERVWISAFLI